jgi:hypothetical protein
VCQKSLPLTRATFCSSDNWAVSSEYLSMEVPFIESFQLVTLAHFDLAGKPLRLS